MPGLLQRIRQKINDRDYYLSNHADEEMRDDQLERLDVENAILKGRIQKRLTRDVRGPRTRIEGPSLNGRTIHMVCRLDEDHRLRIITVYAVVEDE